MLNKIVKNIWFLLFSNYMWLYLIMGIGSTLFGMYIMTFQLLMVVSFFFFLCILIRYRVNNILDLFVIIYVLWIIINSIAIDYENHWKLWYTAFIFELIPLCFYFIGKTVNFDIDLLLEKATLPMIIAMVGGLLFYYFEPAWYTAVKMKGIEARADGGVVTSSLVNEMYRLSSFWVTPYVIGYATLYYANFNLCRLFSEKSSNKKKVKYIMLSLLCVVTIFFTQFRTIIFSLPLIIVYLMFFAKNKFRILHIVVILLFLFIFNFVYNSDSERISYFRDKIKGTAQVEQVENRLEYTGGGLKYDLIWGNGFGRYGASATRLNNEWRIIDTQYIKVLAELGGIGLIIFLGIVLSGLLMAFGKNKMQLEFTLLLFFAIAFIGSSCISVFITFPFIFWYALGGISRKYIRNNNKTRRRYEIPSNISLD